MIIVIIIIVIMITIIIMIITIITIITIIMIVIMPFHIEMLGGTTSCGRSDIGKRAMCTNLKPRHKSTLKLNENKVYTSSSIF